MLTAHHGISRHALVMLNDLTSKSALTNATANLIPVINTSVIPVRKPTVYHDNKWKARAH